ncbi:hypothetical protein V6Z12_A13G266500 [Gossypium hirsutum]
MPYKQLREAELKRKALSFAEKRKVRKNTSRLFNSVHIWIERIRRLWAHVSYKN